MNFRKMNSSLLSITAFFALFCLTISIGAKKKKKGTPNRGAKEQVVSGKVSLKQDEGNFTVIYQIGKLSVSTSCTQKVAPFKGKSVKVTCRVHKGRILTIDSISEVVAKKGKKK